MIELQTDFKRYFRQQYDTIREFVIPFIDEAKPVKKGQRFLEVGSGYGGILKAFADAGCDVTGIELSEYSTSIAREFLKEDLEAGRIRIINKNIYDIQVGRDIPEGFDIIVLKDTIEHIHGQDRFMKEIINFLKPGGVIFFGFPPWLMPFGGHQQSLDSKFLHKLPYFHILPRPVYAWVLKLFGEVPGRIEDTLEVHDTQISINRFERISKAAGFRILRRQFWLVNPSYKHKFGANPRKQFRWLGALPWLRDFFTTTCYYLLDKDQPESQQ
jgi:SAM-dependent methyltransferase